jgi:hypothetical protein
VNVEIKEQSKQWMHTYSPNMPKNYFVCQKANSNCFLRQERSADGGIHTTGDHINVSILQNTTNTR